MPVFQTRERIATPVCGLVRNDVVVTIGVPNSLINRNLTMRKMVAFLESKWNPKAVESGWYPKRREGNLTQGNLTQGNPTQENPTQENKKEDISAVAEI